MNGQTPWSGLFKSAVIIPVITLLLGFSIGFFATSIFPVNIPPSSSQKEFTLSSVLQKPTIDESKLPISLSLLTNPIVYEWRGSVNGRLIAKDEHSFTLEDDKGNKIKLTNITATGDIFNTIFFERPGTPTTWKQTSLSAISIGTLLKGDFFIFKTGPNIPVGASFTIHKAL